MGVIYSSKTLTFIQQTTGQSLARRQYCWKIIDVDLRFAVLETAEIHTDQKGFKRVLHPDIHMKKAVMGWICSYDGRKGNIILK
jgi:hypothetical protein